MKVGFNLGPCTNKGSKALERATKKLITSVCPDAEIKPYYSGYTDEIFDAYFCIGGDNTAYWDTLEFEVTRNAFKHGIPSLGFGLDISPKLGRYTAIPPVMLRCLALFDKLIVRSNGSLNLLNSYGVPAIKVPDLAWCLDAEEIDYDVPENTIAISFYQPIENIGKLVQALVWELRAQGYNVLQILEGSRCIAMEDLQHTPLDATWEQQITILQKCKALITSGFHAAICGYKAGIPVMTLPVQEKTYWLAEELNLPKPLPFSAIQAPRYICGELKKLIDNPPKIEIPSHEQTIEILRGFFNEYVPEFSDNH